MSSSAHLCQMASRFRGCLIGGLIGDCLGSPFEGDFPMVRSVLFNFVNKQLEETNRAFQIFSYTDDTAMTKSVAESLTEMKQVDPKDMAKRFTLEYFRQPKRGYGKNVVDVFATLRQNEYEKPFEPASLQFGGSGSYGNGGAMRIAPIALFAQHLPDEQVIEMAKSCALITHANRNGYNGAILQCLAVHQAIHTIVSPDDHSFDTNAFLDSLIQKIERIENEDANQVEENAKKYKDNNMMSKQKREDVDSTTPFTDKLKKIKCVMEKEAKSAQLTAEEAAVLFGNHISAIGSVPSAIYSVLRCNKALVEDYPTDNPFVRTLYFALSLGGDTDTIGCMALSIAGALYGENVIPSILPKHCEEYSHVGQLADNLYAMANPNGE